MYFTAPILNKLENNPFQKEHRYLPIDFNFSQGTMEIFRVRLPDDYTIIENPQPAFVKYDGIQYNRDNKVEGNRFIYRRQFMIRKTLISPDEYSNLRNFYSQVVSLDESQFVLERRKQ